MGDEVLSAKQIPGLSLLPGIPYWSPATVRVIRPP